MTITFANTVATERPKPLTRFKSTVTRWDAKGRKLVFRYEHKLHPTKGWRRERV